MSKFDYVFTRSVKAVQWNQKNFDDVVELLTGIVESDDVGKPLVYAQCIEDTFPHYYTYYIIQFYAWGNDQEAGPGEWIVVYDDGDGEVMSDEDFTKQYKKA